MHDERTDPSMYHSTEGLVRSSQALSSTNGNFRLGVRFHPGTRTACKSLVRSSQLLSRTNEKLSSSSWHTNSLLVRKTKWPNLNVRPVRCVVAQRDPSFPWGQQNHLHVWDSDPAGPERAQGPDVSAQAEGDLHLLLHVEGCTVRLIRQLRGLQALRWRGTRQRTQHFRQTSTLHSSVRSIGTA